MLYLALPAEAAADGVCPRWNVGEGAAQRVEFALLTPDEPLRLQALTDARDNDPGFAAWSLRAVEFHLGRTINRAEEAVQWLSNHLVVALSTALRVDSPTASVDSAQSRLPLLVARLSEYEQALCQFNRRLEYEKLESLKELAYGASHEINNPLANIAARAQSLLEDEEDGERARKLTAIHRQALRAHEMISDLMLFARPPKLVIRTLDIRSLLHRVKEEMQSLGDERQIALTCDAGDKALSVKADDTQLGVAVQALVRNAIEAVANGGRVAITAESIATSGQHFVEISVTDDGPGISERVRSHMFDPFFSGREAGRGLGFGLSKCWRIVTEHGGQVVVDPSTTSGARISILLPAHSG